MAMTPYGNVPAYNPYNPYSTPANPYAPNPMAFNQPMNYNAPGMNNQQPTQTGVQASAMASNATVNNNSPFIVVNGLGGAKEVQVPPNQTAWMMDSNAQRFYVKAADNLGICKMDCYKFEKFDPDAEMQAQQNLMANQQVMNNPDYITRSEAEQMISRKIEDYKESVSVAQKQNTTKAKKESDDAK